VSADAASAPLDERHWRLRTEIYLHFAATNRAPSFAELADATGMAGSEVSTALDALEAHHQSALLPDRTGIWMANPFSAVPTAFPVDTEHGRYWANCGWDALGVPAILGIDGWTEAHCAWTGDPIAFGVRDGRRVGDEGLIHLVVPPRDAWDDIGFT
jgi:hypothetical protein